MDIKKRDFLTGVSLIGAGLAAARGAKAEITHTPDGAPIAKGRSMLDSPNYFGSASKGGGFNKNWARTLAQVSTVDPNYKPRRVNKAIELWEDNQVAFYNVYMPSGAPEGNEKGRRRPKPIAIPFTKRWENGVWV